MAIVGIPQATEMGEGLLKSAATSQGMINSILNNKLNPYRMELLKAQSKEALAKGAKAQMIADLLSKAMGGGIGGGQGGMSANNSLLLSGLLGLPTQVVEGNLITPFGTSKVGEFPTERRKGEAQTKLAEETLKETAKSAMGGLGVNASFNELDTLMNDPNYKNIAGTLVGKTINAQPFGIPVGAMLQRNFPGTFSEKEAMLSGMASSHFGNIVTGVASKFKGPYKQMVNNIINTMKPNIGDSLVVQRAKVNVWKQLSQLAEKQNELIAENINKGMDPTAAILKASKEISPEFSSIIENQEFSNKENVGNSSFKTEVNRNPSKMNAPSSNPKTNSKGLVVLYKNGKEYHIPPNLMREALSTGGFSIEP